MGIWPKQDSDDTGRSYSFSRLPTPLLIVVDAQQRFVIYCKHAMYSCLTDESPTPPGVPLELEGQDANGGGECIGRSEAESCTKAIDMRISNDYTYLATSQ